MERKKAPLRFAYLPHNGGVNTSFHKMYFHFVCIIHHGLVIASALSNS